MQEMTTQPTGGAGRSRRIRELSAFGLCLVVTAASAVMAKRTGLGPALVAVEETPVPAAAQHIDIDETVDLIAPAPERVVVAEPVAHTVAEMAEPAAQPGPRSGSWIGEDGVEYYTPEPGYVRYFNGRPIRPVRTVWMVTTAYSPDHRSCGKWADGKTASLKSVWTNAMESVAADTRLLPFGTLISVPGYAEDRVVPVFDRGSAIKGARLDVLYATHAVARRWGVQRLPITIWEYVDGE